MTDKYDIEKTDDTFWDLSEYAPKKSQKEVTHKCFSKEATTAVEIVSDLSESSSEFSNGQVASAELKLTQSENSEITRFIPPHRAKPTVKSYTLFSYKPENPLIEEIKVCSPNPEDKLFPDGNMFIRERRALLNKTAPQRDPVSYYSMSPRYSQMSRSQLSYYLWWRDNARKGIFLPADESYIVLYAYELVSCGENEDAAAALRMLCSLLREYAGSKRIGPNFPLMMCDLICDHALVHGLAIPIYQFKEFGHMILSHTALPELFIDLSESTRTDAIQFGASIISMYDFKRSKFYNKETAPLFHTALGGAMKTLISDSASFTEITSFTKGIYGLVTTHRRPFVRMVNIANRNITLEISYHQLSSMTATITDAMRYSENKLREHLGIKGKLHILAVNPTVKDILDRYFEKYYPSQPVIDRRRKNVTLKDKEPNEYDHLYDVPKTEISPVHALEIERSSWDTTKILTETFSENSPQTVYYETKETNTAIESFTLTAPQPTHELTVQKEVSLPLQSQIEKEIGDLVKFISLCREGNILTQRKYAHEKGLSTEELADRINEAAVNCFGDIILEDRDGAYRILEDYLDLF